MRGAWLDDDEPIDHTARRRDGDPSHAVHATHASTESEFGARAKSRKQQKRDERQHQIEHAQQIDAPSWTSAILSIGGLCGVGVIVAGATGGSETRSAAVVMVVLCLITLPILRKLADGRREVVQILYAGFAFKLAMCLLRNYLASGGYYKNSDAATYDDAGRQVANDFLRHGHMPGWVNYTGTNFVKLLTGFVYTITPASKLSAFFVFAWFSFIGTLFFWRAVQRFAPPPSDRKYLLMLMFIPSFVYWPSALGKEAVVIFALGLTTYGFSRTLSQGPIAGATGILGGVWIMTMVRPHVGVAIMVALIVATALAKQSGRRSGMLVTAAVLLVLSGFVMSKANAFFRADLTSAGSVSDQLTKAGKRTTQGGSEFQPTAVSPAGFPMAVVTVLIRPFPWESSSAPELATAIESIIIAWLIVRGLREVRGRIRRDNPLGIYALVATTVFIVLFWNFANFGILARQRTQIAPFLFLLLAMPRQPDSAAKTERKARRSGSSSWDAWDAQGGPPTHPRP